MRREDKLGYGFMLGSIAVPILIVTFFDDKVTAAGFGGGLFAIFCLFLYFGHTHREAPSKRSAMATIGLFSLLGAIIGAFAGLSSGVAWVITNRHRSAAVNMEPASMATDETLPLPTLRQLFDTDFDNVANLFCAGGDAKVNVEETAGVKKEISVGYLYCFDYAAKAKFAVFHIPSTSQTYEVCGYIADNYAKFLPLGTESEVKSQGQDAMSSKDFPFSGRVFIYHENTLSHQQLAQLEQTYAQNKLSPVFRGIDYLQAQILKRAYERARRKP